MMTNYDTAEAESIFAFASTRRAQMPVDVYSSPEEIWSDG